MTSGIASLNKQDAVHITIIAPGIVNGAHGTLLDLQSRGMCILLHQAQRVWLHMRYTWVETLERRSYLSAAYDIELGWCTTLHKVEGMTLDKGAVDKYITAVVNTNIVIPCYYSFYFLTVSSSLRTGGRRHGGTLP